LSALTRSVQDFRPEGHDSHHHWTITKTDHAALRGRPRARGTATTPTEACPATHASRGIASQTCSSRSHRSGIHAQQGDPSGQPATDHEAPDHQDPAPRPPKRRRRAAILNHGSPPPPRPSTNVQRRRCSTATGRRRDNRASPGPPPRHPLLRSAAGVADRPPLPAARCRGHHPDPPRHHGVPGPPPWPP
jgi:hypothetical protein